MKIGDAPVFRRFWYPAIKAGALADGPKPFHLFGEDMVIWRLDDGTVAAVRDACCHRSAKLSLGWTRGAHIVCPYHGWQFDASGQCRHVPQRPDVPPPQTARVDRFYAQQRYGFVWVAVEEPLAPIPDLPEAEDPAYRLIQEFHEAWDMSLFRLVDNWFDLSHVAFVHQGTQGDADRPVPPEETLEETEFGITSYAEVLVANRTVGKTYTGIDTDTTVRRRLVTWWAPNCRKLHITYPNGLQHIIFTAATPLADNRIIFTQMCIRNDTEADVAAADAIAFDRKVTMEDKVILESTRPDVPVMPWDKPEQGMPCDRAGIRARRKLRDIVEAHGGVPGMRPG
jgi:phenylpropionate dioxygenase-like ring-hydroxylating dioxygenase large terminal subunit